MTDNDLKNLPKNYFKSLKKSDDFYLTLKNGDMIETSEDWEIALEYSRKM